jgi:hypothetical protein
MELLVAILINWLIWSTVINILAGKRLIPGPLPFLIRCVHACWSGFWRAGWRHGFKNQYDRRGFLHATGHVLMVLSGFVTLGAIMNPEAKMWGAVTTWWIITAGYWLLLTRWHNLKRRKRRLPRRHRWN